MYQQPIQGGLLGDRPQIGNGFCGNQDGYNAPQPYRQPMQSGRGGSSQNRLGQNTPGYNSTGYRYNAGSTTSIVCRYYKEGKCQKTNCRFRHESSNNEKPKESLKNGKQASPSQAALSKNPADSTEVTQEKPTDDKNEEISEDTNLNYCKDCKFDCKSTKGYQSHIRGLLHTQKVMGVKKTVTTNVKTSPAKTPPTKQVQPNEPKDEVKAIKRELPSPATSNISSQGQRSPRQDHLSSPAGSVSRPKGDMEYYCNVCSVDCDNAKAYHAHTRGLMHTQKVMEMETQQGREILPEMPAGDTYGQRLTEGLQKTTQGTYMSERKGLELDAYSCEVCDCTMTGFASFASHMEGARHAKNVKNRAMGAKIRRGRGNKVILVTKPGGPRAQVLLDECKTPLIGLQHVTEFITGSMSVDPRYVCNMCERKCDINSLIAHCTGSKHRLNYMKEHFMNYYTLVKHKNVRRAELSGMLDELAANIVQEEGKKFIKQKVIDDTSLLERNAKNMINLTNIGQEGFNEPIPLPGAFVFSQDEGDVPSKRPRMDLMRDTFAPPGWDHDMGNRNPEMGRDPNPFHRFGGGANSREEELRMNRQHRAMRSGYPDSREDLSEDPVAREQFQRKVLEAERLERELLAAKEAELYAPLGQVSEHDLLARQQLEHKVLERERLEQDLLAARETELYDPLRERRLTDDMASQRLLPSRDVNSLRDTEGLRGLPERRQLDANLPSADTYNRAGRPMADVSMRRGDMTFAHGHQDELGRKDKDWDNITFNQVLAEVKRRKGEDRGDMNFAQGHQDPANILIKREDRGDITFAQGHQDPADVLMRREDRGDMTFAQGQRDQFGRIRQDDNMLRRNISEDSTPSAVAMGIPGKSEPQDHDDRYDRYDRYGRILQQMYQTEKTNKVDADPYRGAATQQNQQASVEGVARPKTNEMFDGYSHLNAQSRSEEGNNHSNTSHQDSIHMRYEGVPSQQDPNQRRYERVPKPSSEGYSQPNSRGQEKMNSFIPDGQQQQPEWNKRPGQPLLNTQGCPPQDGSARAYASGMEDGGRDSKTSADGINPHPRQSLFGAGPASGGGGIPPLSGGSAGGIQSLLGGSQNRPVIGGESQITNMISNLSQCLVNNEEDASMALQVSNALTQALIDYRNKHIPTGVQPPSNM